MKPKRSSGKKLGDFVGDDVAKGHQGEVRV